ncbi:hypothetical protein [Pseudomonas oryzihabitans]|uniref:hypothetical protein n=1 Tax=Pseudomonas oryzihabitans TaxID=47885 RepID=UPI0009B6BB69|nr:hypothetical protein [Pseudomonas psychrotolerans]
MTRVSRPYTVVSPDIGLLEHELRVRKAKLERSKSALQNRFAAYADEQAVVAALEKSLAKAHRLF